MEKILSYACFKNAVEFEKWQQDNPDCTPTQISPVMDGVKLNFEELPDHKTKAKMIANIKTFVVFFKPS